MSTVAPDLGPAVTQVRVGILRGASYDVTTMPLETYVARVLAGELRDRVLGSQIKAGFVVRGLLPGYLKDPRSLDYATLLEWVRPR